MASETLTIPSPGTAGAAIGGFAGTSYVVSDGAGGCYSPSTNNSQLSTALATTSYTIAAEFIKVGTPSSDVRGLRIFFEGNLSTSNSYQLDYDWSTSKVEVFSYTSGGFTQLVNAAATNAQVFTLTRNGSSFSLAGSVSGPIATFSANANVTQSGLVCLNTNAGGDTTANHYGLNQLAIADVSTPSLVVSPTSGTTVDASTTLSITPTLSNSSASLTASVTGGGTISTTAPTSGTAFTYTPPSTGSGTATVTVSDSTDGLTATCSIAYSPISLTVSPTSSNAVDASTTVSITPTLVNSSAALTASVSGGGTISTTSPTSGTAFTYTPPASGSGTATVTVTDSTDSKTATCSITYGPISLTVSPTSASATDGSTTVSITPSLTNSSASLAASVTGGGTISTATPTNHTAFTYTPPASGSGTATVTVTDSTDSKTATCSITYGPGASLSVSPTTGSVTDGSTTLSITPRLAGSSASLTASVTGGGTISTTAPTSGTAFTYTPPSTGSGTATVTVSDSTDSLTATCSIAYGPTAAPTISSLAQVTTSPGVTISWTATNATSVAMYRSASAPFTPGSGTLYQSNVTSPWSDPSPLAGEAYYVAVATGPGGTATSQQSVSAFSLTWGALGCEPIGAARRALLIGDSITAYLSPSNDTAGTYLLNSLNALLPDVPWSVFNAGAGGSTAQMWSQGVTSAVINGNINSLYGSNSYTLAQIAGFAKTGFGGVDGTDAFVALGINDAKVGAVSASTFSGYVQAICNALPAAYANIWLFPVYYPTPNAFSGTWNEAGPGIALGYSAALKALDGTTTTNGGIVRYCETGLFEAVQANPAAFLQSDGIHFASGNRQAQANTLVAGFAGRQALANGPSAATSYLVSGIPLAPVVGTAYTVTVALNGAAAQAGVVTFGAQSGITWGGPVSIAQGANSGTTTATFTAAGSYTPTCTHTGLGFSGNPTLPGVTASTVAIPTAAQVLSGVNFGVNGSLNGTVALPSAAQVLSGVNFGPGGTIAGSVGLPSAAQVISGINFGAGNSIGGTVALPPTSQVVSGINFGAGGASTGTFVEPSASSVASTAVFGPGGSTAGTLVVPAASAVEQGVTFGPGGSLTGTFQGSGTGTGGGATLAQIEALLAQGIALAPNGLDAIQVEEGINMRQAMSPLLASVGGVLSGSSAGQSTLVIKALGATSNGPTRITTQIDPYGNRSAVTLNLPE